MRRHGMMCERAREWASLRLDGELSELETALLDGHLGRCAECAAAVADSAAITQAIRRAPLQPLTRPVGIPRQYVAFRAARVTAAAAVMLVAAGLGSVFATSIHAPTAHHAAPVARGLAATDDRQLRDMRRAQLRIERAMLQTNSRTQIGHVL